VRIHAAFRAIGSFAVKFRWFVLVAWVIAAIAVPRALPSLSSVTQGNNANFLPASAPSEHALKLAAPLGGSTLTPVPVVAASTQGTLTPAEQAWLQKLQQDLTKVKTVVKVRDLGRSPDGQAAQFQVLSNVSQGGAGNGLTTLVKDLRSAIARDGPPSGLDVHLAGAVAIQVDQQAKSGSTDSQIQLLSIIFIIGLLLLVFRALLAPLVTLIPAFLAVTISGPLVAEAAHHGLKVSPLAQILLIVLVLGAGTDYGLFLVFRVRENLRAGQDRKQAVIAAVERGRRVDHVLRRHGHRGAAVAALRHLRVLLRPGDPASDRHRGDAAGRAHAASRAAGHLRPGGVLAEQDPGGHGQGGRLGPRLVPDRPPPGAHPRGRPGGVRWPGVRGNRPIRPPVSAGTPRRPRAQTRPPGPRSSPRTSRTRAPTRRTSSTSSSNPHGMTWRPCRRRAGQLEASGLFTAVTGPLNPNGATLTPAQLTALHDRLGPPQLLPATPPPGTNIPAIGYQLYRATALYISPDGHTVQFLTGLKAGDPSTTAAMNAIPAVRAEAATVSANIGAADYGVGGLAPAIYDISSISNSDLATVIPIAIAVIGILLALVMRSLVAPLYLIARSGCPTWPRSACRSCCSSRSPATAGSSSSCPS
jgi:RND superfamily putative drug exporter